MALVERETEGDILMRVFSGAEAQGTKIVLIDGAVGCGKSELLELALEQAGTAGLLVMRATGSQLGNSPPMSTLRQLFSSPALPAHVGLLLRRALDEETRCDDPPEEATAPLPLEAMDEVFRLLSALASCKPLVIGVDDVHHADRTSLQYLLHLTRRSRSSRISFVFTQSMHQHPKDPLFDTELLRQPYFRRLPASRLGRRGVAQVLAQQVDLPPGGQSSDTLYEMSGGNPLLVRAAVEDYRKSVSLSQDARLGTPAVGGPFTQAVLACLYRSGPQIAEIAAGLAVLGEFAAAETVGRLLDVTDAAAAQGIEALDAAGIVDGARFRCHTAEAAVGESIDPVRRTALHSRAAALLHIDGAPATSVARHLLACGESAPEWGIPLLVEAADQALADDDVRPAIDYLELAAQAASDTRRAEIQIRRVSVVGRVNPWAAELLTTEAMAALNRSELSSQALEMLAKPLLMQGRVQDVRKVFDRLRVTPGEPTANSVVRSHATKIWDSITKTHEHRSGLFIGDLSPECTTSLRGTVADPALLATTVLWTLTGNEIGEATTGVAEQLLQSCPLTGTMFPSLVNAVKVLAFADRADRAEPWCRYLMEEAERREAPGWRAVFCGVLAEIMLLQGRFAEAEDHAGQALDGVPSRNGSMFAVGPLASQVLAYTAMGRHDDAALRLDQPLPPALFDSVDGLGYLRARGRHYLATNCPQAALDDFLSIGLLAGRWGVDRPALIPWRTDAAEAWLQLGDRDEADRLVTEQLISGRAGNSRTRGMVLRLRAETAEPRMRPKLLTRAVEELQRAGDRYELARALADLGRAYHTLGESARGNAIRQRAWHMADESSARQLCEDIRPGSRETHQVEDPESKLSESERRVAALAAYGHTNREIAAKLYITVSTVEQHLTRVYRKLKITRRHELPLNLRLAVHGGV